MYKLDLEKSGEPEMKLPAYTESYKKEANSKKNIKFHFIDCDTTFDCVAHNKLWKILRDGNTRLPYLSLKKPVGRSRSNS